MVVDVGPGAFIEPRTVVSVAVLSAVKPWADPVSPPGSVSA